MKEEREDITLADMADAHFAGWRSDKGNTNPHIERSDLYKEWQKSYDYRHTDPR